VRPALTAPYHDVMDSGSSIGGACALVVRDLGRMRYADALALQRELQQEVIASRRSDETRSMYLLLVEHDPPVITVSRRRGARRHLTATDGELEAAGVEVAETDRGGDITYHGPGQLVAYPILDLNVLRLRVHSYMRFLEQVVIDALARFGIRGRRDPGATGVWTDSGKICAMGVRVSRWVSMHGLALNVTTNLDHFDLIVPCGLAGRAVTSVGALLGDAGPDLETVKTVFVEVFRDAVVEQSGGAVAS
jgi:lipoyl(octanoyl) transferase